MRKCRHAAEQQDCRNQEVTHDSEHLRVLPNGSAQDNIRYWAQSLKSTFLQASHPRSARSWFRGERLSPHLGRRDRGNVRRRDGVAVQRAIDRDRQETADEEQDQGDSEVLTTSQSSVEVGHRHRALP